MKKRIYLLLLSVTVFFFSCKDKKNDYTEQLFTNNEISFALRSCIDSTASYAIEMLYHDSLGYAHSKSDSSFLLTLPSEAQKVVDTLRGFETQVKLLIDSLHIAAGKCGKDLKRSFWKPTIDSIKFLAPNAVLRGGENAITNYVKQNYQTQFVAALVNNLLKEQFKELNINTKWNELQDEYRKITGTYSSVDILTPTAQQMVDGFFRKMAEKEAEIRKDPTKRGSPNGLFYKVFATL